MNSTEGFLLQRRFAYRMLTEAGLSERQNVGGAGLMTNRNSGGVQIVGSQVNTGGGDIVGRDKVSSTAPGDLDQLLEALLAAVPVEDSETAEKAKEAVEALKAEAAKGGEASDTLLADLAQKLVGLVPSAVGAVVSAFGTPLLLAAAGPVTQYVIGRLGG